MTTPQPAALPEPLGWYVVNNIGMATLCKDEAEAQLLAEDCDMVYQRQAPHRAVQLVALQSQPAARNIAAELSLMVLCAVKDLPGLHANMLKDIESAIEANRAAVQPAAAGVSDADLLVVAEFVGLLGPGSRVGESHSAAVRFARAILALRPQADTLCFELSAMLGCPPSDTDVVACVSSLLTPRPQAVPMTDEAKVAEALRRIKALNTREYGDNAFYLSYVAEMLETCPDCQGNCYGDDFQECPTCNGSGKRHGITAQGAQGGEAK